MVIRLNKVTRDFNVGLSTIVECLHKKGVAVEKNPNTKISNAVYELLIKEFSKEKSKIESVTIHKQLFPQKEKQSEKEETTIKIKVPTIKSTIKVIGQIDLNAINQPTDDLSLYELGNNYKENGEYDKAIENYNKAIAKYPNDEDYYAERGEAKLLKSDFDGAIADFTKVIEILPYDTWGYYMRVWAEKIAKQYDKALEDYNQIIKLLPENSYVYFDRAQLLDLMGRTEDAQADYETIVLLNPVVSCEDIIKPFALFFLGKKAEAIDWQNKILEAYPTAGREYDAACLYSVMNDKELALQYFELALQNGYDDFEHIKQDEDLNNIREFPEFEVLTKKYESLKKLSI